MCLLLPPRGQGRLKRHLLGWAPSSIVTSTPQICQDVAQGQSQLHRAHLVQKRTCPHGKLDPPDSVLTEEAMAHQPDCSPHRLH